MGVNKIVTCIGIAINIDTLMHSANSDISVLGSVSGKIKKR